MSIRNRERPLTAEPHFPEAIAQWRLAMRTQVKSASSLPTSVFHARDSVLEALLAETNEVMLARLHQRTSANAAPADGEQRIEIVEADELRALPQRLRGDSDPPIGLDDQLTAESLAVLTDACCSGHEAAAAGAAAMLLRECAIAADESPEVAAGLLLQRLQASLHPLPDAGDALSSLCQRLVAAIALQARRKADPGGAA